MAEIIRSMNLISVFKQEKRRKTLFYDDIQHTAYGASAFRFSLIPIWALTRSHQ